MTQSFLIDRNAGEQGFVLSFHANDSIPFRHAEFRFAQYDQQGNKDGDDINVWMSEWENNVHGTSFNNGSYLRVIDTDGHSSGNYYLDMFRLNDQSFESSDPISSAWSTEAADALGGIDQKPASKTERILEGIFYEF